MSAELNLAVKKFMDASLSIVKYIPATRRLRTLIPFFISIIFLLAYSFAGDANSNYGVSLDSHHASRAAVGMVLLHAVWVFWFMWKGITEYLTDFVKAATEAGVPALQMSAALSKATESLYVVIGFQLAFIFNIYQIMFEGVGGLHFVYVANDFLTFLRS